MIILKWPCKAMWTFTVDSNMESKNPEPTESDNRLLVKYHMQRKSKVNSKLLRHLHIDSLKQEHLSIYLSIYLLHRIIVSELDEQNIVREFASHWVPHTSTPVDSIFQSIYL